jgi:hypothetical protein
MAPSVALAMKKSVISLFQDSQNSHRASGMSISRQLI